MNNQLTTPVIDPQHYRKTMGRYPTGVALISAMAEDGRPIGMIVGTFTSVSLDPPLVSFMPAKSSTTWPLIQKSGNFTVSVLGAEQEHVVRAFGGKQATKFETVAWKNSVDGNPVVDGAIAWIDCHIDNVVEAGDHFIVLGAVQQMDVQGNELPLLFFQGGFGKFTPGSMAMNDDSLHQQLTTVDRARNEMERLATTHNCGCLVGGKDGDSFILLASAGSDRVPWMPGVIGRRLKIKAPLGRTSMAFAAKDEAEAWLASAPNDAERQRLREVLQRIQERGYSLSVVESLPSSLASHDIEDAIDPGSESLTELGEEILHSLAVPLPSPGSSIPLVLSLYGLNVQAGTEHARKVIADLTSAAHRIGASSTTQV